MAASCGQRGSFTGEWGFETRGNDRTEISQYVVSRRAVNEQTHGKIEYCRCRETGSAKKRGPGYKYFRAWSI